MPKPVSATHQHHQWSGFDASLGWTQPWGGQKKKKLRENHTGSTDISGPPPDTSHQSNFRDVRGTSRSLRSRTTTRRNDAAADSSLANFDSFNDFHDDLPAATAETPRSVTAGRGRRSTSRTPRGRRLSTAPPTTARMGTSDDDVSSRNHAHRSQERTFDDGITREKRSTRSLEDGTTISRRTRGAASTSKASRRSSPIETRGYATKSARPGPQRSNRAPTEHQQQHHIIDTNNTHSDQHHQQHSTTGLPLLVAPPAFPRTASTPFQSDGSLISQARHGEHSRYTEDKGHSSSSVALIGSSRPQSSTSQSQALVTESGGGGGRGGRRGGGDVAGRRKLPMPMSVASGGGGGDDRVFSVDHLGREEDNSFGGAGGLTVEAYMARKRQAKVSRSHLVS